MSDPLENILSAQLAPGERLIWSGKPGAGIRFTFQDVFLIPFSLIWCGFVCFWETAVVSSHAPLIMKLWGIPFILLGIHLLIGRFFVDALSRSRTFYGISQDRILIVTNLLFRNVQSVTLRTLNEITLKEGHADSGSILLGPVRYSSSGPGFARQSPPTLDSIPEVRQVYDLILSNQKRIFSETSR
jgi:hypothetical protein